MQRAFSWRNYEYSKKPFAFSNDEDGFASFKAWMDDIAEKHEMEKVIPGMEPTGHYWLNLWSVPAGTGNEAGTCKSASCQEIQRTG